MEKARQVRAFLVSIDKAVLPRGLPALSAWASDFDSQFSFEFNFNFKVNCGFAPRFALSGDLLFTFARKREARGETEVEFDSRKAGASARKPEAWDEIEA